MTYNVVSITILWEYLQRYKEIVNFFSGQTASKEWIQYRSPGIQAVNTVCDGSSLQLSLLFLL